MPCEKRIRGGFHFENKGSKQKKTSYIVEEDRFNCSVSFGERDQLVVLPKLSRGKAQSSFGEMMLDLTGCESFAEDCTLDVPAPLARSRSGYPATSWWSKRLLLPLAP
jgi:hypothetical protein